MTCGCCSHVGKQGKGGQNVSIGDNCHKIGVIIHELGHVIGFWHEHTRPDRDEYVQILSENIQTGQEHNFNKLTNENVYTLGETYDHRSIMHYARNAYSRNGYNTIVPKVNIYLNEEEMGQRNGLSQNDIIQTNKLYECPKCGKTLMDYQDSFTSPNYHQTFDVGTNKRYHCEWQILASYGERIRLNITDLDMFETNDCQSDYLEIRDGYWHKSSVLCRFCHTNSNISTIVSIGNRMLLTYVSNHRERRGFAANYETVCGGDLSIINGNRIESPNYPQPYQQNKECIWRIKATQGY